MVLFDQNSNYLLKRDLKNSYELRVYESVVDKSVS